VLLRSWLIFIGALLAFHLVVVTGGANLIDLMTRLNALLTAGALTLLGAGAQVDGNLVTTPFFAAEIIFECTAVYPIAMWISAVLAYPARWRPKLLGIALGVPVLMLINVVRLVSLFYVGYWWAEVFETVHLLIWQSLLVFLTLLLWLLWAATIVRRDEARTA
jgi:exosortase H (IPTLxxWG-CTERM-specific)